MPLPALPGVAQVSAPGAPPAGGPSGELPVTDGFDVLFQQLTGRALVAALTPGTAAAAGEGDGDTDPSEATETPDLTGVAAAVPVPVPVPVPLPVEWAWTQPVPGPVDGPGGETTIEAAAVSPDEEAGRGSIHSAQPVSRRGVLNDAPGFAPGFPPIGGGTPVAAPELRGETMTSATPDAFEPAPVAVSATPLVPTGDQEHVSATPVPSTPLPADRAPAAPATADLAAPGLVPGHPQAARSLPAEPVAEASTDAFSVDPMPAGTESAPLGDILAAPDRKPDAPTFAPQPAPGGDRATPAVVPGQVRQGRAREASPEAPALEATPAAVSAPPDAGAAGEVAAPAIPVRRPLPAGALAAMERLASTPVTPVATAVDAVAVRADVSETVGLAAAFRNATFSSNDGFGSHGRDAGQGAYERAAAGSVFRLPDTSVLPMSVEALVGERAAAEPPAAATEVRHVRELEPALADSVHQQIVRSIRLQWAGSLGEARVSLKPEFLGEVTAAINVDRGVVTATLHADTPEVRAFIESHVSSLREALVEHGLRLDRLEVAEPEPQTPDRNSARRRHQQQPPPPPRRRRAADAATPFELISE